MSGRLTLLAVLVPVLGLAVLVGRAEYAGSHGRVWTIPIEGYDPRDLLHGQYLQYRYRLRWQGPASCGATVYGGNEPVPGCCLCLTRDTADGYDPFVRQVSCEEATGSCQASLHSETVVPPLRYFLPEDRAQDVEAALRTHDAAVELTVTPQGEPAVRELLLDRRPWRDVLGP
jgi:GDYXXLXY protein